MAPRTRASDRLGSSARSTRRTSGPRVATIAGAGAVMARNRRLSSSRTRGSRTPRARQDWPDRAADARFPVLHRRLAAPRLDRNQTARPAPSMRACEGGMNDALLGEFVAGEMGDDCAVAKDIGAVAILQFLGFGGVPEEGAPAARLVAQEIVDLELGAIVAPAHRIVHQHDPRVRAERAREQRFLLIAAGERQDVVVDVGRTDLDARAPAIGELRLEAR